VFLKLRPHRQQSIKGKINPKLAPRYYGPFQVLEQIGAVAYKLKLPDTARIHPVFHVFLLKKAVGDYKVEKDLPPGMECDAADYVESVAVLASLTVSKVGESVRQILIQWKGKRVEEATWEEEYYIRSQFPQFSLEDKTIFQEGDSV